jgi:hypothetical protein
VVFFYEFVFVVVAIAAVFVGEAWSRTLALALLAASFLLTLVAYASFGARLTVTGEVMSDDDRRWFTDVRDGVRHLMLLFGLAALAALAWRLIAG